jgi:hypothetical protein
LSDEERKQYDNRTSEFRRKMDQNVRARDVLEKEVHRGMRYLIQAWANNMAVVWHLLRVRRTCCFDRLSSCYGSQESRGQSLGEWWGGLGCVSLGFPPTSSRPSCNSI